MPGNPFSTPTAEIEHFKNILHDLGYSSVVTGTDDSFNPTTWHEFLIGLDNGLYQTGLDTYGDGSDGTLNFIASGSTTVAGATFLGYVHHDP